ncbi:FAD-dependent pyridine nucleotide-disulfide oxidoreductase [Enhygromyxa salina]|uniref:FAD-dependent pyridine nucleotide-disulfide oxidoreductase n=1 Tax=Enhygromyxa salina TaxID=215803 RepID=A0A0C2CXT6_9BACT|nr:FAD/NAD(P)-binding oxidoreductase [Enhygromyxa salina]KIG15806.1 FAD-dependent pyridine nucleotide-disulfide oxidoreductase [Enhygromyxa salina]
MADHHQIIIVGGGTAGITVAARLLNADPKLDVAIIEPSNVHYYQPLWTLVGGGEFPREVTARPMANYIPPGATWVQEFVDGFDPANKRVDLRDGTKIGYDQLVVCPGIQLDWGAIEGLSDAIGTHGLCSNYSYETVEYTWECIANFRGGRALFTAPAGAIKCGGAPQKIMWLAEENFRKRGVRADAEVSFAIAGGRIFGVEKYRRTLERLVQERDIVTRFGHDLISVDPDKKIGRFRTNDGETLELDYELMHVTPPQSAPDFIKHSPLADEAGWLAADKYTTQHPRFPDVFSLGDASSLPCSKTGAAVRKQAPVTVANLLAHRAKQPPAARYDGYSSCPIITGVGQVMLAEFDYDGTPTESFPFDQAQPRYSMYLLKAYGLPEIYWNGMLRGRM